MQAPAILLERKTKRIGGKSGAWAAYQVFDSPKTVCEHCGQGESCGGAAADWRLPAASLGRVLV